MSMMHTCQPVANIVVLDLPDAGGLRVDVADGGQLMREVSLLADKANGIGIVWAQRLRLTIHLSTAGMFQEHTDFHVCCACAWSPPLQVNPMIYSFLFPDDIWGSI